ncbi:MAG TPA: hypothetical protein P5532_05300 [Planctomycetota bacterium]|nr:hypothetical protein [Planctomycetota bacterium]
MKHEVARAQAAVWCRGKSLSGHSTIAEKRSGSFLAMTTRLAFSLVAALCQWFGCLAGTAEPEGSWEWFSRTVEERRARMPALQLDYAVTRTYSEDESRLRQLQREAVPRMLREGVIGNEEALVYQRWRVPGDASYKRRLLVDGTGRWRVERVEQANGASSVEMAFDGRSLRTFEDSPRGLRGLQKPGSRGTGQVLTPLTASVELGGVLLTDILLDARKDGEFRHSYTGGSAPWDCVVTFWGTFKEHAPKAPAPLSWVKLFLDSRRGYTPLKVEFGGIPPTTTAAIRGKGLEQLRPVDLWVAEFSDHQEVAPGLWLPRRIVRKQVARDAWPESGKPCKEWAIRQYVVWEDRLEATIIRRPASTMEFAPPFPDGTPVVRAGPVISEYVAGKGLPGTVRDEALEMAKSAQIEAGQGVAAGETERSRAPKGVGKAPTTSLSPGTAESNGAWLVWVPVVGAVLAILAILGMGSVWVRKKLPRAAAQEPMRTDPKERT